MNGIATGKTMANQPKWYSKKGSWNLFLMAALPLHLWAILLVLNDFSWISERTNVWDAIGVGAYGLLYALLESILVFFILLFLGLLLPKRWSENKRISMLTVIYLVAAIWAMIGQVYFLVENPVPQWIFQFLIKSGHPLRIIYVAALTLVGISVMLPVLWVIRSERATYIMTSIIDRLALLSIFYLFFDLIAVIVVLIRNVL
jgi:hypothetical protein